MGVSVTVGMRPTERSPLRKTCRQVPTPSKNARRHRSGERKPEGERREDQLGLRVESTGVDWVDGEEGERVKAWFPARRPAKGCVLILWGLPDVLSSWSS